MVIDQDYLEWPKELINDIPEEMKGREDSHLVFEYAEGDEILNGRFKAPRSNRFYFVIDPNGGTME